MSDVEPAVNHGLGAIVATADNTTSGTPKGSLRWSDHTGPLWAISRKLGVARLGATQLTPFRDPRLGSCAETISRLVFEQATKRIS